MPTRWRAWFAATRKGYEILNGGDVDAIVQAVRKAARARPTS